MPKNDAAVLLWKNSVLNVIPSLPGKKEYRTFNTLFGFLATVSRRNWRNSTSCIFFKFWNALKPSSGPPYDLASFLRQLNHSRINYSSTSACWSFSSVWKKDVAEGNNQNSRKYCVWMHILSWPELTNI